MSDDNTLPFERRGVPRIDSDRIARIFDAPHKGLHIPGHPLGWPYEPLVVALKRAGKGEGEAREMVEEMDAKGLLQPPPPFGESLPARLRREQDHLNDAWRYALDQAAHPSPRPSWSVRYGFALTVMLMAAAFAYMGACIWKGPNPLAWAEAEWLFVSACLLIGAGYIAWQDRR